MFVGERIEWRPIVSDFHAHAAFTLLDRQQRRILSVQQRVGNEFGDENASPVDDIFAERATKL